MEILMFELSFNILPSWETFLVISVENSFPKEDHKY